MKKLPPFLYCKTLILFSILFFSCNERSVKETDTVKADTGKAVVKKPVKPEPELKYKRPPIINIVDTVAPKRIIVFCKDSAASFERISLKLGKIYGSKLADYIKKSNIKMAGAPMAWYKKHKAPYFFEAGIPVNKKSSKSAAGVQIREIRAGNVIVAHFYGPYELVPQGYDAIREWMKENKKIPAGPPYEMYVTDPVDKQGKPIDPYKIQTDIIFPVK